VHLLTSYSLRNWGRFYVYFGPVALLTIVAVLVSPFWLVAVLTIDPYIYRLVEQLVVGNRAWYITLTKHCDCHRRRFPLGRGSGPPPLFWLMWVHPIDGPQSPTLSSFAKVKKVGNVHFLSFAVINSHLRFPLHGLNLNYTKCVGTRRSWEARWIEWGFSSVKRVTDRWNGLDQKTVCARSINELNSRPTTTWPVPRTLPSGVKDASVLLMAAAPCDVLFYGAVYKCTHLLTYFLHLIRPTEVRLTPKGAQLRLKQDCWPLNIRVSETAIVQRPFFSVRSST